MSTAGHCDNCGHLLGNHTETGCGVPDCRCGMCYVFKVQAQGEPKLERKSEFTEAEWRLIHNALCVYQMQQNPLWSGYDKIQPLLDKIRYECITPSKL